MATRFPNSYAFFQGVDDGLKYNTTRDANARAELKAEDESRKAMQDLLTGQATEERNAALFSSQEAARKLAQAQAAAGLDSLTAALPVSTAEQGLSNMVRGAAVERGKNNFGDNQKLLDEQAKLSLGAKDIALKQIAVEQDLIAKFPDLTNPGLRKQLANLLALGTPPETIKAQFPEFTPYLEGFTTTAAAAAGLVSPVTTAQTSVTAAQALAAAMAAEARKFDNTGAIATKKTEDTLAIKAAETAGKIAVIAAKPPPGVTPGNTAGDRLTGIPGAVTKTAATPTAVPTAAAPADAPVAQAAAQVAAQQIQQLQDLNTKIQALENSRPQYATGRGGAKPTAVLAWESGKGIELSNLIRQRDAIFAAQRAAVTPRY